jgi:MFS transporter, MHS family, shikimate and dehydroshikimate transport protein
VNSANPSIDSPPGRPRALKLALATSFGTAIEMYDFFIYGTAAALVFNHQFFPTSDPLVGTLLAFAAFGVGFLARPLGGVVIGHFGDRVGRKKMLVTTLVAMGMATFLIGLLPTYAQIGVAAPILLVALRLVQGFCAGGEWAGAVLSATEHAPANKRGLYGSWASIGNPAGLVLATGAFTAVSALPAGQFEAWGWRLPFLASALLVVLGLYVRVSISETPEFLAMVRDRSQAKLPIATVLRTQTREVLLGTGVNLGFNTFIYLVFTFALAYSTTALAMDRGVVLTGTIVGSLLLIPALLFFAALSDRVGRYKVMLGGAGFVAVWALLFFPLLNTARPALAIAAVAIAFTGSGALLGPMGAGLSELFGPSVRYTGASLGYQLGAALGGGLAPFIATALFASTGTTWSIAIYSAGCALISLVCIDVLRRRAAARSSADGEVVELERLPTA